MFVLPLRDIAIVVIGTLCFVGISRFVVAPAQAKRLIGNVHEAIDGAWLIRERLLPRVAELLNQFDIVLVTNRQLPPTTVAYSIALHAKRLILTDYSRDVFSPSAESFIIAHEVGHFAMRHFSRLSNVLILLILWSTLSISILAASQVLIPLFQRTASLWPSVFWIVMWLCAQVPFLAMLLTREIQADRFALSMTSREAADEVLRHLEQANHTRFITRLALSVRRDFCRRSAVLS